MAIPDGCSAMSSVTPDDSSKDVKPEAPEELPPPPPPEPEPEKTVATSVKPPEEVWMEDYDELIGPEEKPKPRKRKNRHWGAIIVTVAVIVFFLAWTFLSPKVMTQVGQTYVNSATYASWGNFTGYRDIWAGNMTWGLSISGRSLTANSSSLEVHVLLTKVYEKPGNWFFRGTSVTLNNVSIFEVDGTYVASMSNWTDVGYGLMATVPVTFATNGTYDLYVHAKFTVYEVMRIGFIPLEAVEIEAAYFDEPVIVD